MVQYRPQFTARLTFVVLSVVAGLIASAAAFSQTLPVLRTVYVARYPTPPNPCYVFGCFERSSYNSNTLAAIGETFPAVYVFRRLSTGPWYPHVTLQNRTPLAAGYDTAGYRWPVVVVGNDIFATAFQSGPNVRETCETHVFVRNIEKNTWSLKQVINVCAAKFAKDGTHVLFAVGSSLPIYVRGADGTYTEESRLTPPTPGLFEGDVSFALSNWTVVVGTPSANFGVGAAHIFQRVNGAWVLSKTLTPTGLGDEARFGQAVAAYEYNVAIGAPGAINPAGVGSGIVYMYTGVGENWELSQEIAEPVVTNNNFGMAIALRGRRLVIAAPNFYPYYEGPEGYYFERGLKESAWVARGILPGDAFTVELSGNTVMSDAKGLRGSTFPTVVNLPALREPDVAP